MKYTIALLAISTALSACVEAPAAPPSAPVKSTPIGLSSSQIAAVHSGVKASLKDPGSAQFSNIQAARGNDGSLAVCGLVNAKNSYGGYTGSQPFIGQLVGGQMVVIAVGGQAHEIAATKQVCASRGLRV